MCPLIKVNHQLPLPVTFHFKFLYVTQNLSFSSTTSQCEVHMTPEKLQFPTWMPGREVNGCELVWFGQLVTGSWKEGGRLAVCKSTGGSVDSPHRAHPLILSIASTHSSSTRALPPHTVCDNSYSFCNNLRRHMLVYDRGNLLNHCRYPLPIVH